MENSDKTDTQINMEEDLTDQATKKISYKWGYLVFLVVLLGLAHVLDEYSSLAPEKYASAIIKEFFLDTGWFTGPTAYEDALAFIATLQMISFFLMIVGVFFKALQDKIGRKIIFIISAVGMTLGVLTMVLSQNYWMYYGGSSLLFFFIFQDMQYAYINEDTPTKWRGTFFALAKILGLAGLLLVPVIYQRNIIYIGDTVNWRPIMYPPLIIGAVVIIAGIIFLKEPRAYQIMKEERRLNPDAYKDEKMTLRDAWRAMRKMPSWKQIVWLTVLGIIMTPFATVNQGLSDHFLEQISIHESFRPLVQTVSTVSIAAIYIIHGVFADRVGRKPAYLINAALVVVLLPTEYLTSIAFTNSPNESYLWIAAIAQGVRVGAFWNITDVSRFMQIENLPTHLRGRGSAIMRLFQFIGMVVALPVSIILIPSMPNVMIGQMIVGIPICIALFVIALLKLKETKDVDITKIEG